MQYLAQYIGPPLPRLRLPRCAPARPPLLQPPPPNAILSACAAQADGLPAARRLREGGQAGGRGKRRRPGGENAGEERSGRQPGHMLGRPRPAARPFAAGRALPCALRAPALYAVNRRPQLQVPAVKSTSVLPLLGPMQSTLRRNV